MPEPTLTAHQDLIRQRAYTLWQSEGCPDGCADRHWQQAEQEVQAYAAAEDTGRRDTPDSAVLVAGTPQAGRAPDPRHRR